MSRSSKKVPFVAPELIKRIEAMNADSKLDTAEFIPRWRRLV